jgi:hypothetical protein
MSTLISVPRDEWREFFDRLSTTLLGKWAEVEVASLDLGDQIVAEWVPMLGITYDSEDNFWTWHSTAAVTLFGVRATLSSSRGPKAS